MDKSDLNVSETVEEEEDEIYMIVHIDSDSKKDDDDECDQPADSPVVFSEVKDEIKTDLVETCLELCEAELENPNPENMDGVVVEESREDIEDPAEGVKDTFLFSDKAFVEISRCSWDRVEKQNFLRGCMWSPDGTCLLAPVNNDGMQVFELPSDMYQIKEVSEDRPVDILQPAVHVKEGGTVYDLAWYPCMNSLNPESCCWLASRQHEPIQMWDAFNGSLRCSYRGYDNVDEVESALSLTFSPSGEDIYAGYKKSIKIFKTNVPGRDYQNVPTKSTASCISVNSVDTNLVAFGSWNRSISILDSTSNDIINVGDFKPGNSHVSGITHLKFFQNGTILVSGARKDPQLYFWDLRNLSFPIYALNRTVETNQRIYFDLSSDDQWLVSGDTLGLLHVWDLFSPNENSTFKELQFPIHNDCCNGVSIHPHRCILATSSGQYHFDLDDTDEKSLSNKENSLIFWWFGKSVLSEE